MKDGSIHNASKVVRQDKNWQSNVFAGPKIEESKRKRLNHNDKGKAELFGDSMEQDAYNKRTNLAAAISQKEKTRPPVFDNSNPDDRRQKELYGNSNYQP